MRTSAAEFFGQFRVFIGDRIVVEYIALERSWD